MNERISSRKPARPTRRRRKGWQRSRPEKVARAKKLVADADYPTPEIVAAVAELIAQHVRANPDRRSF